MRTLYARILTCSCRFTPGWLQVYPGIRFWKNYCNYNIAWILTKLSGNDLLYCTEGMAKNSLHSDLYYRHSEFLYRCIICAQIDYRFIQAHFSSFFALKKKKKEKKNTVPIILGGNFIQFRPIVLAQWIKMFLPGLINRCLG